MTGRFVRVFDAVPSAALWLGFAGLIPFFGLAVLCSLGTGPLAIEALTGYGAVILSFMGGCRWGFAAAGLGNGPDWLPLGLSVVPALFAWAVSLLAPPTAMGLLAIGFIGLLGADIALARAGGAPKWWPALRWPLSIGAAGSLAFGALSA